MWEQKAKWVHFVGIGGIAVGQLALAYAEQGYTVTGSDQAIYEPMKSLLASHPEVQVRAGYNFQNLLWSSYTGNNDDTYTIPELVVAGGGLSPKNRELLFAHKRGLTVKNYAQVFASELVVPGKSLVVAGSFGKTTVTALLVSIFKAAGIEISYMFGGMVEGFELGVKLKTNTSEWSIIEGDEYISARNDLQSKFFYYQPTVLVLTGYAFDHADVFPTPEAYLANFTKLVAGLPADGLLIYNANYPELEQLAAKAVCRVVGYEYQSQTQLSYKSKLIGEYNRENVLAALTAAKELAMPDAAIKTAIETFVGVKRRLEIRSEFTDINNCLVIDDFGSTPAKARASIATVRADFPDVKLLALFEPNIGMRNQKAVASFANVFDQADQAYILPFTAVNQAGVLTQSEFVAAVSKLQSTAKLTALSANPEQFKQQLQAELESGQPVIFLFLSSHAIDNYLGWLRELCHGQA